MLQSSLKQTKYYAQDTKELQMYSVIQFMSAIGYTLHRTQQGGLVFVYDNADVKVEKQTLSVQTAIRLHNADWCGMGAIHRSPCMLGFKFYTDIYTITQAKAAKVVEKVKLQYCKRSKSLKLQHESGHMVRFVNPSYQYLFLMEEV